MQKRLLKAGKAREAARARLRLLLLAVRMLRRSFWTHKKKGSKHQAKGDDSHEL